MQLNPSELPECGYFSAVCFNSALSVLPYIYDTDILTYD